MAPRGIPHSQISDFWRGCRLSSVSGSRRVLSLWLPMMGIAFVCVWAAYATTELPETAAATMMSSEVAAVAPEPSEVAGLVVVFP